MKGQFFPLFQPLFASNSCFHASLCSPDGQNVLENKMSSSHSPKWHGAHKETMNAGVALGGTDECPFSFGKYVLVFVIQQGSRCLETKEKHPDLVSALISARRFSLEIGPVN